MRSELLPHMYDDTALDLFAHVKAICDPDGLLNPGIITAPSAITDDLRPMRPRTRPANALALLHDDGDLGAAVHRCTGVGTVNPALRAPHVPLFQRGSSTARPDVWIWADSFTDHFFPESGLAALRYLRAAGLTVDVIPDDACCGLTWITTGQLGQARKLAARTVERLNAYVETGVPVLGLEPSCTATLRSDALELTENADRVAAGVLTFAELVTRLGLPLPDLTGVEVVAQPHCHHSAVLGWDTDAALLRTAGAAVPRVAGCCGLAGNFGVEAAHYEVSAAVAETHLLPNLRAHPAAIILADGMSCRVQVDDLTGRPAMHLAELFAHGREGAARTAHPTVRSST